MKLLLVEDDRAISRSLKHILEKEGYQVDAVFSMQEAERFLAVNQYNIHILDVRLPDGTGFDVCTFIRQQSEAPILFLSVENEEDSIVEGLTRGGDDYIIKPFKSKELLVRLQKLLMKHGKHVFVDGDIRIDMQSGTVKFGNEMVNLSTIEYRLLLFFANHKNEIVKREDLYELIWDSMEYVNDSALSASIKRLREKFNGDLEIVTVRGQGYLYKHEDI